MAAPTFVGAGTGVVITGTTGVVVAADIPGLAIGDLIILQILEDTSGSSLNYTPVTGIAGLDGTANFTTVLGSGGVGSAGFQDLRMGRVTSTSSPGVTVTSSGTDLFCRIYAFRNVNTGATVVDIVENGAGSFAVGIPASARATGTTAAVADVAVTTLDADRLALNFIAVDDDNPLAAFAGMTGGVWAEPVAEFASATGTDGAIQLQIGQTVSAVDNLAGPGTGAFPIYGAGAISNHYVAQSFLPPVAGSLVTVEVGLNKVGAPTDNVVVEIQSDSSGVPSGTVLASASIAASSLTTTHTAYSFSLPATLVAATTYWIVVKRDGAASTVNYYSWQASTAAYASGAAKVYGGAWGTASADRAFRVSVNAAGTIDGGTQTMAAADNWGVIGFALKPLPSGPATLYGATASPYTFAKAVAGQKQTYGATATPLTVAIAVAGQVSVPAVTHYGALAAPFAFNAAIVGQRKAFGATANPYTFAAVTAAQRKTFGATATPITFSKAVAGSKQTFGQTALPITFGAVVAGIGSTGAVTHYGQLVAPFTFGENTQATRRTYGATANPYAFSAVIQGRRRTTSSISAPFVFSATTAAQRKAFGAITAPFIFGEVTQGRRRTTSSLAAPFTFTKDVRAQRRTTGATTTTVTFGAVTASRKQYARTTASITFGATIVASKKTYGVVARPITFGAVTAGIGYTGAATYFGATAWTITFGEQTAGKKKTYGVVARPITFAAVVQCKRTTKAQVAAVYTWSSTTQARRKTHAQIAMPIQWLAVTRGISTVGIQTYYGQLTAPFTFNRVVAAQRRTFSTTHTPITMSAFTKGMLMAAILNYADDIRWGTIQADRVMVGTTEVWTPGEDL